jgi:hypothetical protein
MSDNKLKELIDNFDENVVLDLGGHGRDRDVDRGRDTDR